MCFSAVLLLATMQTLDSITGPRTKGMKSVYAMGTLRGSSMKQGPLFPVNKDFLNPHSEKRPAFSPGKNRLGFHFCCYVNFSLTIVQFKKLMINMEQKVHCFPAAVMLSVGF